MTVAILLLTCLLLTPWLVQFARYAMKRPEAIPTPTWMVTSSFVFLFLFPLNGVFVSGESLEDQGQAAIRIMFTTIVYWVVFTGVYLLATGRSRTVMPDGPRGIPTSFGVLKQAAESTTMAKAMLVFIPLTLIKLYFLRSAGLGISGGGLAILDLPYHLVILRLMTTGGTTAFSTVFAMHLFGKSTQGARLAAAGGILTNLVFAVMAGRRPVLFTLALVALGAMWAGRRRQANTLIGLGVAVWFLLYVFSPIFLRAREIWRSPDSPGVMAAFEIAMRERDDSGDVLETESEENIKQRMNTYRFWLSFYDRYGNENLGGTLLIQAVVMTIPRAIAGWAKYAYGATEEAVFGTQDIANNVCLESFIDLGLPGPFVYGIVFGLLFAAIDSLVVWMSRRNKYIALMAIGAVFTYLISPEADLMTYFGSLRHIVILSVLTFVAVLALGLKPAVQSLAIGAGGRVPRRTTFVG